MPLCKIPSRPCPLRLLERRIHIPILPRSLMRAHLKAPTTVGVCCFSKPFKGRHYTKPVNPKGPAWLHSGIDLERNWGSPELSRIGLSGNRGQPPRGVPALVDARIPDLAELSIPGKPLCIQASWGRSNMIQYVPRITHMLPTSGGGLQVDR